MIRRHVITICYFMLGVCMEFPMLAIKWMLMTDYGISIAQIGLVLSTLGIPWTIKPLYGFLSDNFPIRGQRRKPYIVGCNLVITALWLGLCWTTLSETALTVVLVVISTATCFADVMYDASMVEAARLEKGNDTGSFQSLCWTFRNGGSFLASIAAGLLLNTKKPRHMFLIQAVLTLFIAVLCAVMMREPRTTPTSLVDTKHRLWTISNALSKPALWKPAIFVLLFAATPSSGTAWFYYLIHELQFSPEIMGLLHGVRHGSAFVGAVIYRNSLRGANLRRFFSVIVLASATLSLVPLLLYYHFNRRVGVPDVFFVAGDDVFLATMGQIAMMPCLILVAKMCPDGVEASMYATFVGLINLAGIVSDWGGGRCSPPFGGSRTPISPSCRRLFLPVQRPPSSHCCSFGTCPLARFSRCRTRASRRNWICRLKKKYQHLIRNRFKN